MYDPKRDYRENKEKYQMAINNVLDHGLFINGPEISQLENKLKNYVGSDYCISVASGTDALLVALMSLDITARDEVITVAHTWISTAEVISLLGAKPVFVDIEDTTYNMDLDKLEAKISDQTKAIIPVSLYGQMLDYDKLNKIAEKYKIPVIEDAAQSFGAKYNEKYSCAVTRIGCTSFFPSKPLGCWGDGGAVFTNDQALANKIRAIKNHGCLKRFKHTYIGLNARLDTLQAAVLLVKLDNFDYVLEERRKVANYYTEKLGILGDKIKLPITLDNMDHVWAQYSILVKDKDTRDFMVKKLKENNVNVAIFYPAPLHLQECFKYLGYKNGDLSVTERVADLILNLPCYGELRRDEQDYIIETFVELYNGDNQDI